MCQTVLKSSKWVSVAILSLLLTALSVCSFLFYERYRLRTISSLTYRIPTSSVDDGFLVIHIPGSHLVGELALYEDELFAYLMFDYLRTRPSLAGKEFLLTHSVRNGKIVYALKLVLVNDFISGPPQLYKLASDFPFLSPIWISVDDRVLRARRAQTRNFIAAYNFPQYKRLEQISRSKLVAYTRRFIRFKSSTDPRIRRRIEPIPRALTADEAEQLADDIVQVAKFYELPLDFFLGIGAMENNYMNVKGDLGHAIWKRRASKGDIILRRSRDRVLVLNESSGVWQITRETLRYAHTLYLRDKRNYNLLPAHLRPPKDLDVDGLDHRVLTLYAGLLFRDLLDRFQGDTGKAVGAYNGGPGNPNANYEAGVRTVAEYARKVLEQSAALRGRQVVDMRFLRAPN
jgi:hypothetical protein